MFSQEITNLPSIIYSNNDDCKIIVNAEFEKILTKKFINNYIKTLVNNYPILRSKIENRNNKIYFKELDNIDINKNFEIKMINYKKFDEELFKVINSPFKSESKWFFHFCIDKKNKKSRFYFKIDHSYADGYQIIKMLSSPVSEIDNTTKFKRQSNFFNKIYYFLYGTFYLLITFIIYLISSLYNYYFKLEIDDELKKKNTEFIICDSFDFDTIKEYTRKKGITINDFFYSIMVKANNIYTGENKKINCISPINVSNLSDINNMIGLYIRINNNLNPTLLTKKINSIYNNCKYSIGSYLISSIQKMIMKFMGKGMILKLYDIFMSNIEYCYTNVIGPDYNSIKELEIEKISFFTTAQKKEICFNIISYNNKLNLNICYKEGIIKDVNKFNNSIKQAYNEIINN